MKPKSADSVTVLQSNFEVSVVMGSLISPLPATVMCSATWSVGHYTSRCKGPQLLDVGVAQMQMQGVLGLVNL